MLRKHCLFSHSGTPTTQPGTDDDNLRIGLSRWITEMLVHNGDEQPGQYQTPGANGYTPEQLAPAPKPKAAGPTEQQLQAAFLKAIRAGATADAARRSLGLNSHTIYRWRQQREFLADYNPLMSTRSHKPKYST